MGSITGTEEHHWDNSSQRRTNSGGLRRSTGKAVTHPSVNIAFVLSCLADTFGGPVTAVKGLGRMLTDLGQCVSYWATADGDSSASPYPVDGAHISDVNWPRSWYRSKGLWRGLSAEIASLDVLELNEFWPYPIYAGSRVASRARIPYILRPAGSLQSWCLDKRGWLKKFKKTAYLGLVGRSIMHDAACIRAASTLEAENIHRLGYQGPVTVIPNGLNVADFSGVDGSEADLYWPDLRNRPVVLFMSRLSPEKGLDLLVPAWAELRKCAAYRDGVVVIAGPDSRGYREVVEAMLDHYGLRSQVITVGMVRGRQKAALLRRADVFTLPSYSENFGMVVAEALACGTPVITTTHTPWEQLHQIDAGRWIAPEKSALLDALRELLSMSVSQRAAMGNRGMNLIYSNYTWDKIARKFLHVCDCILDGRPIPLHPTPEGGVCSCLDAV